MNQQNLQLEDQEELVRLIPFEGEGSKETGWWGTLLGDSFLDFRGDHAEAAYEARNQIKEFLRQARLA